MIQAREALKGRSLAFRSGALSLQRRRWNSNKNAPSPRSRHLVRVKSLQGLQGLLYSTLISQVDLQQGQIFEPQMNLSVAVVCLVAATPPVVYWVRFFLQSQKRAKEKETKEKERQERIDKLVGRISDASPPTDRTET